MINPGLGRIQRLLSHLPPQTWPAIHVAGTNGKGSVCAYLTALFLHHAKHETSSPFQRVGRFTSPHLLEPRDSITINGEPISRQTFSKITAHVATVDEREGIGASEFELLTASAYAAFSEAKVDLAIVECGMGGRLDATNVLTQPIVTVITRLGYDHQAFLGDTAAAIAMEKSGIMRQDVPCVVDASSDDAFLEEVTKQAKDKGVTVNKTPAAGSGIYEQMFSSLDAASMKRLPNTAKQNMWTAYLVYKHVLSHFGKEPGSNHSASAAEPDHAETSDLAKVMLSAANPGRFQTVEYRLASGTTKSVILDGAHNVQAFSALVEQVQRLREDQRQPVMWVLASTTSRDPKEILQLIPKHDRVVATEFSPVEGMPWVKPVSANKWDETLGSTREQWNVRSKPGEALETACVEAGDGLLIVAGSLYLVSDVLRLLEHGKIR